MSPSLYFLFLCFFWGGGGGGGGPERKEGSGWMAGGMYPQGVHLVLFLYLSSKPYGPFPFLGIFLLLDKVSKCQTTGNLQHPQPGILKKSQNSKRKVHFPFSIFFPILYSLQFYTSCMSCVSLILHHQRPINHVRYH